MTVKELIEELKKLPPDAPVYAGYYCDDEVVATVAHLDGDRVRLS